MLPTTVLLMQSFKGADLYVSISTLHCKSVALHIDTDLFS